MKTVVSFDTLNTSMEKLRSPVDAGIHVHRQAICGDGVGTKRWVQRLRRSRDYWVGGVGGDGIDKDGAECLPLLLLILPLFRDRSWYSGRACRVLQDQPRTEGYPTVLQGRQVIFPHARPTDLP